MARTILLVEDDPNDSRLILDALKEVDPLLNVRVEKDGLNATAYLKGEAAFADRNQHPLPDAILLDLELPMFNGYEFLGWLRKYSPPGQHQIPVVVITGTARDEDISRAYLQGANSVIIKPTNAEELTPALRSVARFWSGDPLGL